MGIPINGSFENFVQKLQNKNIRLTKKYYDFGEFTGTYKGNKAKFIVRFDHSTRMIFQVKIVIGKGQSRESAYNVVKAARDEFRKLNCSECDSKLDDGTYTLQIYLKDSNDVKYACIDTFIEYHEDEYQANIWYTDRTNLEIYGQ